MNAKARSLLVSILFVAALWGIAQYLNRTEPAPVGSRTSIEETQRPREKAERRQSLERHRVNDAIGFASREKLVQHYRKHGREFGAITMEEYLQHAQHLRDRPLVKSVLQFVRNDGVASRFGQETGTFIAFNSDKTIRTCFKPNDGVAYFERQKYKNH